jgi:hypothetical protein
MHYTIILFVYYGPPPTTRDTVLATIVASGRAQIQFNIEAVIN